VPEKSCFSSKLGKSGLSVTIGDRFTINLEKDFNPSTLCQLIKVLEKL
jgi:hypothetical protein